MQINSFSQTIIYAWHLSGYGISAGLSDQSTTLCVCRMPYMAIQRLRYVKMIVTYRSLICFYFRVRQAAYASLTLATTALKAAGLLRARSASTLRLIAMPDLSVNEILLLKPSGLRNHEFTCKSRRKRDVSHTDDTD